MTIAVFEGASAIVSGGAGGLGEATVRRLHAEGLAVIIADMADDKGKVLADELGEKAAFVSTDVTDEESVQAAINQANSRRPETYSLTPTRCRSTVSRPHSTVRVGPRGPTHPLQTQP